LNPRKTYEPSKEATPLNTEKRRSVSELV
jgi:hypothetical protein